MSKFRCRCGYEMVFRTEEEDYKLALVPEKNVGNIISVLNSKNGLTVDQFVDEFDSKRLRVFRCPQCDRLWVENEVRGGVFRSYIKEEE